METLTAREGKQKNGIWYFMCPLHEPVQNWHESNSMVRVLDTMKRHMDDNHPGVKAKLRAEGEYLVYTIYTAISIVETKEEFL